MNKIEKAQIVILYNYIVLDKENNSVVEFELYNLYFTTRSKEVLI